MSNRQKQLQLGFVLLQVFQNREFVFIPNRNDVGGKIIYFCSIQQWFFRQNFHTLEISIISYFIFVTHAKYARDPDFENHRFRRTSFGHVPTTSLCVEQSQWTHLIVRVRESWDRLFVFSVHFSYSAQNLNWSWLQHGVI